MKNNIKEIRIKNNITQENLARIVDVTTSSIQNIENKNYEPKIGLAIKLKRALNVSNIEELFNIDE